MRSSILHLLLLSLTLSIPTLIVPTSLLASPKHYEVGAIDIMQEKNGESFRLLGQACGETHIYITNTKGATITPTHFSASGDVDWSVSTIAWAKGTYTIVVNAAESGCVTSFTIRVD